MLLGWWNMDEVDWWKRGSEIKIRPEAVDYNKAQLLNMTGVLVDFNVTYLSYTNVAVFTIAKVLNDILGISIFNYEDIFHDKSLNSISLTDEICTGGIHKYLDNYMTLDNQNGLFDANIISEYIHRTIDANIGAIYNTGIAYNDINIPELSSYYPRVTVVDSYKETINSYLEEDRELFFGENYLSLISELQKKVNIFTANYYSAINAVLGEAINYINQKVSEIKNQQELNSIMPSGPIDLVTRINPEAAVQQPVQQAVPVQPTQQAIPNPAALSPEEEKAVQMMINGMFFENMMQNAQQGVPVPQM